MKTGNSLWQRRAMIKFRPLADDHPDLAHSPQLRAALLTLQYAQEHGSIIQLACHFSGAGMNSPSSPGGRRKGPFSQSAARQAFLASSSRSREDETKFHQM